MDIESLEKFCKKRSIEITDTLMETYDSADFESDSTKIEGEIYDIALSYSKTFFFEAQKFLNESVRNEVKSHLISRFEAKKVQKMKDIDLIAHWIKSEVIRALEEKKIFF